MSGEVTRRQFVRSGAGLAVAGAALTTAQTATASHLDGPGENVELVYDQDMLEAYQPRLVFPTEAREKLIGLYGWVARSADEDTDVCCYWARYTHQDGLFARFDSHHLDHEPVQVEVDSETGDVRRVRASVYHWLKGEVRPSEELLYDGTHPHLRVISPWHQYTAAGLVDDGVFVDVEDLTGEYESWLKNGLEEDLYPGATTVPWRMQSRDHFWQDTLAGISVTATVLSAFRTAGIDEAGSLEVSN